MPMHSTLRQRIAVVLLTLCCLVAPNGFAPGRAQAQTGPAAMHANGWSFADVIRVGQNGFTALSSGRAGPAGSVAVSGTRNGREGIFYIQAGVVTEVAANGTVLPNGLGTLRSVGISSFQYAVLPNGNVLFDAFVENGPLNPNFRYTFQWSSGTITVAEPSQETDPQTLSQAFTHDLRQVTTDDRWLATLRTGTFPNEASDYGLTNGAARQPIFSFARTSANCAADTVLLAAANADGVVAYYRVQQTRAAVGGFCQDPTTRTWSVNLAGSATGQIAGGSSTEQGNSYTGVELSDSDLFLTNNQNQVAAVRKLFNSPTTFIPRRQLVIFNSNGSETIVQDTDGPVSGIFLADFDQQGRVLYSAALDNDFTATVLLAGPDLEADRVLRTGDSLFGQTVNSLGWVARPAAPGANTERAFAFQYGLSDGSIGIALARQQRPRWTNPAGGDWGTAGNWTPAGVPSAGDEVIFDLPATYGVNLGERQVGGVAVENGDVTFRNSALELAGAEGGSLGVSASAPGATARLTIAGAVNARTVVTASLVGVGVGGPGELRIENATIQFPEAGGRQSSATLGFAAPATATVTAGSFWLWQEMSLGLTHDALLRVDDGAVTGFGASRLWVGGSVLGLEVQNRTGQLRVDNGSDSGGLLDTGTLLGPIKELIVGESLIGRLDITNGGRAIAITTTVGTRDHGAATTDGFLTVEGTTPTRVAHFTSGQNDQGGLFVATGNGAEALVTVSAGGAMSLTQLSLADGAQSNALMFVDGLEAADGGERRSTVVAPLPLETLRTTGTEASEQAVAQNAENGNCVIGRAGQGTLNVSNGGLVRCRQLAVGFGAGSRGELNVAGVFRSVPAEVIAGGPLPEDGAICIGRVPLCGGASGSVRGQVVLGVDGILAGRIVGIGAGGRLRGSGITRAADGVVVFDGGSVAPGIVQIGEQREAGQPGTAAPITDQQVGTLTIQGNLTISRTGGIILHLLGATAALQDRLVVSGTANLDGDLTLNFGNGYAPKQGDQLTLIRADAVNGAPQNVHITGLEPGFAFDLTATGGTMTLTALNDGVATPPGAGAAVYLPLVTKPY